MLRIPLAQNWFSQSDPAMERRCMTSGGYWSSKCQSGALKSQCTPSTERRIRRWEHEAVLEEMQNRLSNAPEMMRIRKRTVEHPFGTLKQWMGATHFLTRKLAGVSAEMSLNVLAYNLKRVMNIIGANGLMKALSP
ncbi:transposase [Pseudomonas brenneri]